MSSEASAGEGDNKTVSTGNTAQDSIVLEEEIDPDYVPTESEIVEYAKWLGMDLEKDKDLFWVAKEGLMAPLPKNWKPCKTKQTEDIYYFNFATGESTWDHPCDGYYKRLFEEAKKKKEMAMKESSDQNRTQAKADVEKLTGKAEKKKRKKTDKDSLASSLGQKSGTGSAASNPLGKAPLAPIGGALKTDKKPLPGIAGLGTSLPEPKRSQSPPKTIVADNLRKSEVSLLTSSFDSSSGGSGAKAETDKAPAVDSIPKITATKSRADNEGRSLSGASATSTGTKRSKISSRLAAVVSDSGENQLPSPTKERTPTKSSSAAVSTIADSKEGPSEKVVSTLQQEKDAAPASALSAVSTAAVPSIAHDSEAKSLMSATNLEFEDYKSRTALEIASLTTALRKAEDALHHKKTQCDRLSSELTEIERSLNREKQNQSMAEQTESALLRQARDAKDQLSAVQSRSESLQKENDEYRIKIKELTATMSNDETEATAGEDTIAALKEQIKVQEASIQRSTELQNSMREELANQSSFYEAKIRSSMKASADAAEDLTRLQSKLDKAVTDSDKSNKYIKENMSKLVEDAQNEVADLKLQIKKEKDAVCAAESARDEANSAVEGLKVQLTTSKYDLERSEQMMTTWETDAKEKEKKLAASRSKVLELEEEKQKLELENKGLQSRIRQQQLSSGEDHQAKSDHEVHRARLAKDKADLETQLSELKDESESLRRRLKDALASDTISSSVASSAGPDVLSRPDEVAKLQSKCSDLESMVRRITSEKNEAMQRSTLLEEQLSLSKTEVVANKEMLTKLQTTRDTALESVREEMQKNMSALEIELSQAMKASVTSKSDKELLQIKVDSLTREVESTALQHKKLNDELHRLNMALMDKDSRIREQEVSIRDATLNDDVRGRTVQNLEQENASHRSTIARQQEEITRLHKALSDSDASATRSTTAPIVPPAGAPMVAPGIVESTILQPTTALSGQGMMDLGVLVGQQQANAALLESRLKEADTLLTKIQSTVEQRPSAERNSTTPLADASDTRVADKDLKKANEIMENLERDNKVLDDDNSDKSKLLMEMLTEFAKRRQSMTEGNNDKVNLSRWTELLAKEIKFVTEARKALRDEKIAIKWEQQLLLNRREVWKKQRHTRSSGTMHILNTQTSQLNEAVERVRKTTSWLNSREVKLQAFQDLLRSAMQGDRSGFLQIKILIKELESDTLDIGLVHPFGVSLATAQDPQFSQGDVAINTMPDHLSEDGGARVAHTYFPPELRAETNNYLAAQENRRPSYLNATPSGSVMTTDVNPVPIHSSNSGVVSNVARERADGESAYGAHANWLDSIRVQIDGFNPRTVNDKTAASVDASGGAGRADDRAQVFEL